MSRLLAWVFGLGFAAALIALIPLRAASAWIGLDRFGLSAAAVHGTVWSGRLDEARLYGAPLGEVTVSVDPLSLMTGEQRLRLKAVGGGVTGQAILARRGRLFALLNATGEAPLSLLQGGLPLQGQVRFERLSVRLEDGRCRTVQGKAAIDALPRNLGVLTGAVALAGEARCDGDAVLLPLRGKIAGAAVDLQIRIGSDGRYRVLTNVAATEPQLSASLRLAGFVATGSGTARTDEGKLWP